MRDTISSFSFHLQICGTTLIILDLDINKMPLLHGSENCCIVLNTIISFLCFPRCHKFFVSVLVILRTLSSIWTLQNKIANLSTLLKKEKKAEFSTRKHKNLIAFCGRVL